MSGPIVRILICSVFLGATPIWAEPPALPDPILPEHLEAYADPAGLTRAIRSVSDLLRSARLTRITPSAFYGDYVDAEYSTRRRWDEKRKEFVTERSPCESDVEAMAVHRGWAWFAIGYNIFARTIEGREVDGSKIVEGRPSSQSIDLHITRPGRSALLRVLQVGAIAHSLEQFVEESKLSIAQRAEMVAFLKTLLAFKRHHDVLVAQGDTVRDWMNGSPERARDLVSRINSLLPSGEARVNTCLEGYVEHVATLDDGRQFGSGSIYSGGIAMYSVGFWWRREGEGTSHIAQAALNYTIERLER